MRFSLRHAMIAMLGFSAVTLASGGGENVDPVKPDFWQAAFTIAVFLILLFILGKFAFKPIMKGLNDREAFITNALHDADEASKKALAQLAAYEEKLNQARAEATAIVEEGRRDAEVTKRSIHDEARTEADKMIERAKREIGIARDSAVRELCDLGATLATDAASKIVGRELSASDHERLIRESIDEIRAQNASQN
jgi:F-type H+-transporting ATPase subunit b